MPLSWPAKLSLLFVVLRCTKRGTRTSANCSAFIDVESADRYSMRCRVSDISVQFTTVHMTLEKACGGGYVQTRVEGHRTVTHVSHTVS